MGGHLHLVPCEEAHLFPARWHTSKVRALRQKLRR